VKLIVNYTEDPYLGSNFRKSSSTRFGAICKEESVRSCFGEWKDVPGAAQILLAGRMGLARHELDILYLGLSLVNKVIATQKKKPTFKINSNMQIPNLDRNIFHHESFAY
jgi:hypothetical protein